jgi:glyoxylase-like metal-dependent hydrolase (beta-lactamase superfamily II)
MNATSCAVARRRSASERRARRRPYDHQVPRAQRGDVARRYGATLGGEPDGVRLISAKRADEVALWLEEPRAVVSGDAIIGDQRGGLRPCPWYRSDDGRAITLRALRPLLELPVGLVLPTHGEPVYENAREALARALEP